MALHIIVESSPSQRRWRAEVDPEDGWTRLFDGASPVATAWYCAPDRWERIEPDTPPVRDALSRVAATLGLLGFTPEQSHPECAIDGEDCEAV